MKPGFRFYVELSVELSRRAGRAALGAARQLLYAKEYLDLSGTGGDWYAARATHYQRQAEERAAKAVRLEDESWDALGLASEPLAWGLLPIEPEAA